MIESPTAPPSSLSWRMILSENRFPLFGITRRPKACLGGTRNAMARELRHYRDFRNQRTPGRVPVKHATTSSTSGGAHRRIQNEESKIVIDCCSDAAAHHRRRIGPDHE